MRVDVRVMLEDADGETFMGIGVVWLLEKIEQHRSISRAARDMDLSYPKAIRIIKNLEAGVGRQVLIRRKGGSSRGGAELTPFGRDFLRRFARMQERIRDFAARAFDKDLAGLLTGGDE